MKEIWRDVVGYEGLYEVSNMGRIKSLPRKVNIGNSKNRLTTEKNLKPEKSYGYLRLVLNNNNIQKHYLIHRLVAQAFIPNPENKSDINHIDSNRSNNIISNLEWVTRKENMEHCIKMGRNNRGEKQGSSVLKEKDIIKIRKSKLSIKTLADKFNVSKGNIYHILKKETWKHI